MEIHEVFAYLRASDAEKAIEYYKTAFGAVEKFRLVADEGRIGHCGLLFGDTTSKEMQRRYSESSAAS